jgi:DNA-binding transcriptional ArsR family regulator
MDSKSAILCLSALAQPTRLETFRLLVRHEPNGLPAGESARLLDVPQNTMSTHLAILARAQLVTSERQSRSIIYRANLATLHALALYLIKDCCAGQADLCGLLAKALEPCC